MRTAMLLLSIGALLALSAGPARADEVPSLPCSCQRHPESVFNPNPKDDACCDDRSSSSPDSVIGPWQPGSIEPPPAEQAEQPLALPAPPLAATAEPEPPPPAVVHRRAPPPPAWSQPAQPAEALHRSSLRPWKWTALATGLVLAGGGAALLALDGRFGDQCWLPGDLSTCKTVLQTQPAGAALVGVGAASLVGAVVLFTLDARHKAHRPGTALLFHAERGGLSLTATGAK